MTKAVFSLRQSPDAFAPPFLLTVQEPLIIDFPDELYHLSIDIATNSKIPLTLRLASTNVTLEGTLEIGGNFTAESVSKERSNLQINQNIEFSVDSYLIVKGSQNFVFDIDELRLPAIPLLPCIFSLTNTGFPQLSIERCSHDSLKIPILISTEDLEFDSNYTSLFDRRFPLIRFETSSSAIQYTLDWPSTGLFGFTQQDSIARSEISEDVIEIWFDLELSNSLVNRICYGDDLSCHQFSRIITNSYGISLITKTHVPAWTKHLEFYINHPTSQHLDLDSLPSAINLSVIGLPSIPAIDLKSSGLTEEAHYHFSFLEFRLEAVARFCCSVTIDECTFDSKTQSFLKFESDVAISFGTFRNIVDNEIFASAKSLLVFQCTDNLMSVVYETDCVLVQCGNERGETVVVSLRCSIPLVEFEMILGALIVDSRPWEVGTMPKYGITFSGNGIVEFASTYNVSLPECSPHVFRRGQLRVMLRTTGTVPHFVADPDCDFAYTIPEVLKTPLVISLPQTPVYPVKANQLTFNGISSIKISPESTELIIGELIMVEYAHATFSSLFVTDRMFLKRGTSIVGDENSVIAIANRTSIRINWRIRATPRITFLFKEAVYPRTIEMVLDFADYRLIAFDDYFTSLSNRRVVLFSGIPATVCDKWTSAFVFHAVVPVFNGSSSILSLDCIPDEIRSGEMNIAMSIRVPILPQTPLPSETSTPNTPPENTLTVISSIIGAFTAAAIIIGLVMISVRGRRFFQFYPSEEDPGMTYV
jgi:hypothetical protein